MNFSNILVGIFIVKEWLNDYDKIISFNRNLLFFGNVDVKKIREVVDLYGFFY